MPWPALAAGFQAAVALGIAASAAAAAASAALVVAQVHGISAASRERGQPLASRSMRSAR